MEYNEKLYTELLDLHNKKMKTRLRDMIFLELNKDICLSDKLNIDKEIPLPILSKYLIKGIESSEYLKEINFENIIVSMIYVIGCDHDFKYNNSYIKILKDAKSYINGYLLNKSIELINDEKYLDALIYLNTLDKISDNHWEIRYNIANTMVKIAEASNSINNIDNYNLYNNLSFFEFLRLSWEFPFFSYPHYHMGFYYIKDKQFEKALDEWEKAYENMEDEDIREELKDLIDNTLDNMSFEEGKLFIIEGNIQEGLKRLIPLTEKHELWGEAKYFTALGYRKLGNYEKAELLLMELINSGETFSEIYNELGLCYFNLEDNGKALEYFKIAVGLKGDDAGYLCNLGVACYKSGNDKKAKEYIYKAYNINPEDELTMQCKEWIDSFEI